MAQVQGEWGVSPQAKQKRWPVEGKKSELPRQHAQRQRQRQRQRSEKRTACALRLAVRLARHLHRRAAVRHGGAPLDLRATRRQLRTAQQPALPIPGVR